MGFKNFLVHCCNREVIKMPLNIKHKTWLQVCYKRTKCWHSISIRRQTVCLSQITLNHLSLFWEKLKIFLKFAHLVFANSKVFLCSFQFMRLPVERIKRTGSFIFSPHKERLGSRRTSVVAFVSRLSKEQQVKNRLRSDLVQCLQFVEINLLSVNSRSLLRLRCS